jgi:hypothetical protein
MLVSCSLRPAIKSIPMTYPQSKLGPQCVFNFRRFEYWIAGFNRCCRLRCRRHVDDLTSVSRRLRDVDNANDHVRRLRRCIWVTGRTGPWASGDGLRHVDRKLRRPRRRALAHPRRRARLRVDCDRPTGVGLFVFLARNDAYHNAGRRLFELRAASSAPICSRSRIA